MPGPKTSIRSGLLVALLLPLPSPPPLSAQEGLTLREAYQLVRESSPRLEAARQQVVAAEARIPRAGALPDPAVQIGASTLELPGLSTTMAASMAPSVGISQAFPLGGKRGLREDMAALDWLMAEEQASQVWWHLRAEVSDAFYRLFEAERQIQVQELARQLLAEASTIAEARYASGAGRQTDVLRASVAVARTDSEIRRLQALRQAAASRLNGLLDRPFDEKVPPAEVRRLPVVSVPLDSIRAWGRESQPGMRMALLGVQRSETGADLAHKEIWPDVQLSLQYGTRDRTSGREHMGGAAVGFTLPLFAGRKQYALRDEAMAGTAQARARLREMQASLDAGIGTLLSDVERTADLVVLFQTEILPQARATAESALSSYRSGSVEFLTLLDAELALVRFEGEFVTLLSEYGTAQAALEAWVGRELPSSEATLWESQ